MQYRRHEEFGVPSSTGRNRQTDLDPDHFLVTRFRRSVSPRRMERVLGGDRRSDSLERRNYGWDVGVNRDDHLPSRSPPYGEVKRGPRYDDGVIDRDFPPLEVRGRYEFIDRMGMNMNLDVGSGRRNDHDFKHSGSRAVREDFDGGRLNSGRHGMVGQNSMVLEDGPGCGMYRLAADAGPTSKYEERGGKFASASASANMGLNQLRDERARYPDPFLVDKLSSRGPYREGEKSIFNLRDDPYTNVTASKSKDLTGSPHFKDFAGTSAGNSRANFPSSYRGGVPLPVEDHPKSSVKITEPLGYAGYGPRQIVDTRDPDVEIKDDLVRYGRDTFSPTRSEHRHYLHRKPIVRENDDYVHPSDEIYRRMDLRERMDYSRRDLLRPSMVDPVTDRLDNTDFSRGNLSNNSAWDHHSHEKQTVSNYIGLSRSSAALKQGGQYLDSTSAHFELGRKISREAEMPYLGMSRDREISHLRTGYDFKRDMGPESYKERVRSSPDFSYDTELHRLPERTRRIEEELGNYDPSNRVMKRKYRMDEEMSRRTSRNIMPSEWNNSGRREDQNDRNDEWTTSLDATGPFLSKRRGYAHGLNRRVERAYDGDYDEEYTSEDWFSSHDQEEHLRDHSTKSYKYGSKYSKGHSKPGSLSWYNSNHPSRKHVLPKWKNVWIRGKDDNDVNAHAAEVEQSEDWVSSAKSEPPEDSEEFQQLVHKFFLSFTKKLNDNPGVRKRYQEHGRAGSLFCIVCGRSLSKEFMDTQRLATHAFMSHKVGLRAQHLGLLKAICVLLGWSTAVVPDTVTWFPAPLSSAEALAQKEDLILWPPVIIIHNSSVPYNDSEGRGVITVEALEDFLRGKGFGGGKIRTGRSANHSIMVVRYLGTFSGLEDAEKLHRYFAENKHGRKEYNQMASSKGKSSTGGEGEMKEDKVNELVLYGYMGIAEDLDSIDNDTKRKCLIKSKKEIQDLVDAPVKPE